MPGPKLSGPLAEPRRTYRGLPTGDEGGQEARVGERLVRSRLPKPGPHGRRLLWCRCLRCAGARRVAGRERRSTRGAGNDELRQERVARTDRTWAPGPSGCDRPDAGGAPGAADVRPEGSRSGEAGIHGCGGDRQDRPRRKGRCSQQAQPQHQHVRGRDSGRPVTGTLKDPRTATGEVDEPRGRPHQSTESYPHTPLLRNKRAYNQRMP